MQTIRRFLEDQSGATAIEYSMIGGLVSIMVITGATAIGTKMYDLYYDKLAQALQ